MFESRSNRIAPQKLYLQVATPPLSGRRFGQVWNSPRLLPEQPPLLASGRAHTYEDLTREWSLEITNGSAPKQFSFELLSPTVSAGRQSSAPASSRLPLSSRTSPVPFLFTPSNSKMVMSDEPQHSAPTSSRGLLAPPTPSAMQLAKPAAAIVPVPKLPLPQVIPISPRAPMSPVSPISPPSEFRHSSRRISILAHKNIKIANGKIEFVKPEFSVNAYISKFVEMHADCRHEIITDLARYVNKHSIDASDSDLKTKEQREEKNLNTLAKMAKAAFQKPAWSFFCCHAAVKTIPSSEERVFLQRIANIHSKTQAQIRSAAFQEMEKHFNELHDNSEFKIRVEELNTTIRQII